MPLAEEQLTSEKVSQKAKLKKKNHCQAFPKRNGKEHKLAPVC